MKGKGHSPLKCCSDIFKAKGHLQVRKSTPRTNESSLMLALGFDLNLIISRKSIHKGENFASYTLIQNLVNKWCGKIILRTGSIQISKISAYSDRPLLLFYWNGVWHPLCQWNVIDNTSFEKLLYIFLNRRLFPRIDCSQMLSNMFSIRIGFDFMLDNARVNSRHFLVRPSEHISKLFKNLGVLYNLIGGTIHPNVHIFNLTKNARNIDRYSWLQVSHFPFSILVRRA